ncbi:hypothetical protein [Actinomadura latina]|uniref:hypothetical protein n=1 Tax=Actinomadura latina TaxID=163603 RepID=UPI000ADFF4AF|nr:hypothetical protein [Actinomadura latina]
MREISAIRLQLGTVMSVNLTRYYQETGTSPGDLFDPSTTARKEVSRRTLRPRRRPW